MERVTLALGGNALGNTPEEQKEAVKLTSKSIVDLIEDGILVTIVHGNGPQVGMIKKLSERAHKQDQDLPNLELAECGAMSQGYIGYHLQNALVNELRARGLDRSVVSLVSQVEVDQDDPAFKNPTKPIGGFMTRQEAEKLKDRGLDIVEDSGRGYRQVVASPRPIRILEEGAMKALIDQGHILIAGGGGGIPVVEKNGAYLGVPAVIDKDLTAVKVAQVAGSDRLIILTAVDYVYRAFGREDQEKLEKISLDQARTLAQAGEFAQGSMLPKIQAAIQFVEENPSKKALIGSLDRAREVIRGESGSLIYGG